MQWQTLRLWLAALPGQLALPGPLVLPGLPVLLVPLVLPVLSMQVSAAPAAAPMQSPERIVIHAGMLLRRADQPPERQQTLLVERGRIVAIRPGYLWDQEVSSGGADPSGGGGSGSGSGSGSGGGGARTGTGSHASARFIDLSDRFVLPGLIDLHVHLTTEAAPGEAVRVVTRNAAELALVAAGHARETLEAGFTTVLDLGTARRAHNEPIYALRRAIERGEVDGPRLLVAGSPVSTTGSSRTGHWAVDVETAIGPDGVCNGADDCARATRQQIADGADVINMYNTGSIGDLHLVTQAMTDSEMKAVVESAHAWGRKVVADGHTPAGINAALKAGADIVDTAPWLDNEAISLMKRRGVFLEPHMHAFRVAVADMRSGSTTVADETDSPVLARLKGVLDHPFSAEIAYRAGISLAYGSDTGIVQHGDNAGDLLELTRIGMSPARAIQVATLNSAAALGLQAEIGSLEPGKRADIIATRGNPLEDLGVLRKISFLMRDGHVLEAN